MREPRKITTVGLVGCGRMGGPIGGHLRTRDWPVVAYDRDPDALERMVAKGATAGAGIAGVARESDLVLLPLVDDAQVIAAVEELLPAARPGAVVAICASVRPDTCRELAERARPHDVHVIDVAMVRAERAAENGELALFCGGDEAAIGVCYPPFQAFATTVSLLGPVGAGQVAKIVNNLLLWACLRIDVEALRLARALGVAPARIRPIMATGSGANAPMHEWGVHRLRWPHKDLETAVGLADELGVDVPLVRSLPALMRELTVADLRDLD
jgi:3-hydroxyisobutyrate dehydrogenase-like beta-hydroxyacid dehydrogenase